MFKKPIIITDVWLEHIPCRGTQDVFPIKTFVTVSADRRLLQDAGAEFGMSRSPGNRQGNSGNACTEASKLCQLLRRALRVWVNYPLVRVLSVLIRNSWLLCNMYSAFISMLQGSAGSSVTT